MLFGLSKAPASFQGYINKILAEKLDIFVIVYLDDILIYSKDLGQGYLEVVQWVFEQFRKDFLYAILKKCRFHQEEVRFLDYVVLFQGICMEDKRIEDVKSWPKLKSVRDIQAFIGCANFYCRFIRGFSKIAAPLTLMLKTSAGDTNGAVSDRRQNHSGEKVSKITKSKSTKSSSGSGFLTPEARIVFIWLRQALTKAPILQHFDLECHIKIKTDAFKYAIGGVLNKLTLQMSQRNPMAFFSRKMIPVETCYETHDGELLAIIEALKTWHHYLEGCKHKVLMLTNYNNLCRFIDTKSLSSRQVCWA